MNQINDTEDAIKQLDETFDFLKARAKLREAMVEIARLYGYETMKKAAQAISRQDIMERLGGVQNDSNT